MRPDGFTEVGPVCVPFDCQIDLEDAEALRDVLVQDFFHEMKGRAKTPLVTESEDKTICSQSFQPELREMSVVETPIIYVSTMLHHTSLDSWRMAIMQSKARRASWNNAQQKIATRLNVEVFNGRLVEAVRKMKIIRGVGELTVAAIENQTEEDTEVGHIVMQRRAYERHMTKDDCQWAIDFLQRTVRRSNI